MSHAETDPKVAAIIQPSLDGLFYTNMKLRHRVSAADIIALRKADIELLHHKMPSMSEAAKQRAGRTINELCAQIETLEKVA